MNRRGWLMLGAAGLVAGWCASLMVACPAGTACSHPMADSQAAMFAPPLLVLLLGVAVWAARTAQLLIGGAIAVRRLSRARCPGPLRAAMARIGAAEVICLDEAGVHAFCAGALRPRIYLTKEMAHRLRARELDAVLLHEIHHQRWREPLVRTMRTAAADVLFFAPVVRWWVERRREGSELAADRHVLRRLGPQPLAGALWAAGGSPTSGALAAFDGATLPRVAQVLGEPVPRATLSVGAAVSSASGLTMALAVVSCLTRLVPAIT